MSNHRLSRISEEVKREVSDIIRFEIKDPRISSLCSIVAADVTPDLKFAKLHVSVLGNEEDKESTIKGLNSASGFIRKELGSRLKLRHIPDLTFVLDKSIEHGAHILKLLNEVKKNDGGESS